MRGINAPVVIYSPGQKLDYDALEKALLKDCGNVIAGISCNSVKQAILDDEKNQTVLFLKGIDPAKESSVTTLAEKITLPLAKKPSERSVLLPKLLTPNSMLVGYKTAQEHGLEIGQTVTLLIPEPTGKKRLSLRSKKVTVAGIFKIGLEEYDNNMAFVTMDTLNSFFDEQGVDQIIIKLLQQSDRYETRAIAQLQQRLPGLTVTSWKNLYPAVVASLKLEKYVMFFILALITLVACMNMISLLFMQIQHKRRDIAIFKAMGMAAAHMKTIFLFMGMSITLCASLVGLALAALAGFVLERYPFIELPDVYYVSYLPARMDAEIFVVVFIATLLLGFLATWIPATRASRVVVAQILRQE